MQQRLRQKPSWVVFKTFQRSVLKILALLLCVVCRCSGLFALVRSLAVMETSSDTTLETTTIKHDLVHIDFTRDRSCCFSFLCVCLFSPSSVFSPLYLLSFLLSLSFVFSPLIRNLSHL